MSMKHKDLEFIVTPETGGAGSRAPFRDFTEACHHAVAESVQRGGQKVHIDVLAWSRKAAEEFMGDDGAAMYDDDPEASVFTRIEVKAENVGRIP